MTLALLLTAVGGAWADETLLLTIENKDYTSFTSGSMTFDDKVTVTFSNSVLNVGNAKGWFTTDASQLTVAGTNGYTITSCKFYTQSGTAMTGYTVAGESPSVYLFESEVYTDDSKSVNIGYYGVMKIEVFGAAASAASEPDIEVTTNAAEEGATFTEAWFNMPANDMTADYELVRDMSVQMTAQVGDGTQEQPRYRVKKDGNKFIPADMEMAAVPALFTVNDAIEQKALTQTQDYIVQIYAIDADGQPTGQPMTFATFTFEPGIYAVKAVAAQGSDYAGETALSNTFQLCVKSDLTLTAGSDFTIDGSKATLTVDGTDKSAAIAEGKLADVDMNANVSIAANDGYVMTALSVTCGEQNVSVNTADGVSSFTMPEAPATVAYTLTRDMSVKVTTQIAERVRIQKKEGKFDAVDPFELIPILTDKIGSTDKKMFLGEETGTSGDFYIKGIQKLDGEDWVDATELGVGTYRLVIAGKGNYDGTIYTAAIELYQGYEVTIPAGEFITYFKDENLKVEDAAAELYTIKSVTATEAVLSSKLESVPAGVPMLVYNNSQEEKTFVLIPTEEIPVSLMWSSHFKGTLEAKDMPASSASTNYYGCTGKAFVWLKSAGKIAANRCWLEISTSEPNSARKIVSGNATGIGSMVNGQWSMDNYYDMQGRKVEKPVRGGIYIKNGKKVIVK